MSEAERFWEDFYAGGRGRWSGNVNAGLAEEVADLTPGTALDLGCGQGGDAIWLAQHGWAVTAADVSATALETAARHAAEAGVADAITFERHDLGSSLPAGEFDLVSSAFLHSEVELPRVRILRAAAERVAPGGTLVVLGHAPSPEHHHADLPGPDEVLADLALPDDAWITRTCELRERRHTFAGDDHAHTRIDSIVRLERRPG